MSAMRLSFQDPLSLRYGLSTQPKAVDIRKFRHDIVTVALGGFETGLFHGSERFFVKATAAAFGDLGSSHVALWINLDSQCHIAFKSRPQRHWRVNGTSSLDRFGLSVGAEDGLRRRAGRTIFAVFVDDIAR
jgi:hypothetical protein